VGNRAARRPQGKRRAYPVSTRAKRAKLALRLLDQQGRHAHRQETADIIRLSNVWGSIVVVRVVPLLDPNLDLSDK